MQNASSLDVWQRPEYLRFLNTPGFWIYHGSEYVSGYEYARPLNMTELYRVLNVPAYAWIIPKYTWLCLKSVKYAGICIYAGNIREFT